MVFDNIYKDNFFNYLMDKRGRIALTQILILIIGIVAVSYAIGSEIGVVKWGH